MSLKLYRNVEIDSNTPLCVLKFLISTMGRELDTKTLFERRDEVIKIIREYKPLIAFVKDEHLPSIIDYITPVECIWEKEVIKPVFYKIQKFFECDNYELKFYDFGDITPNDTDKIDVVMLYKIIKTQGINFEVSDTFSDLQNRYNKYLYNSVNLEKNMIVKIVTYSLEHIDETFLKEIYKRIPKNIRDNYREIKNEKNEKNENVEKKEEYTSTTTFSPLSSLSPPSPPSTSPIREVENNKVSDNNYNDKNHLSRYFYPELSSEYTSDDLEKLRKYYPKIDQKFNLLYNSDKGRITFSEQEFSVENLITIFQNNNYFKNPIKGNEKKLIERDLVDKLYNIAVLHEYKELEKEILRVKPLVVDNFPPVKNILNKKSLNFDVTDVRNYFKEILRFCFEYRDVNLTNIKEPNKNKVAEIIEMIKTLIIKIKKDIIEFPLITYEDKEFKYTDKRLFDCINSEYVNEDVKKNTHHILSSVYYYNRLFNFKEYFPIEKLEC